MKSLCLIKIEHSSLHWVIVLSCERLWDLGPFPLCWLSLTFQACRRIKTAFGCLRHLSRCQCQSHVFAIFHFSILLKLWYLPWMWTLLRSQSGWIEFALIFSRLIWWFLGLIYQQSHLGRDPCVILETALFGKLLRLFSEYQIESNVPRTFHFLYCTNRGHLRLRSADVMKYYRLSSNIIKLWDPKWHLAIVWTLGWWH